MMSPIPRDTMVQLARTMGERAVGDGQQVFGSFFLLRLLGLEVSYAEECCIVAFDLTPGHFNPQGTLHGGILTTAMDISMGHLLHHFDGPGATLEMKTQFLAPVSSGRVRCEGSFLRRGRSVSFLQSRASADDGTLIAHATATWRLLRSGR